MSSTTIIELRQVESQQEPEINEDGSQQNGVWTNTLREPIMMTDGMQISVKSCFLDTSAAASGYIEVENDIPVVMSAALYLTNYNLDQTHDYAEAPTGVHPLRTLATGSNPATLPLGDNNKWFLAEVSTSEDTIWSLPQIEFTPLGKDYNNGRVGGVIPFIYTSTAKGAEPYKALKQLTIKSVREHTFVKENPFAFNVSCTGSVTVPAIELKPGFDLSSVGIRSFKFINSKSMAAGTAMVTPQIVQHSFTIPGGPGVVYSPLEISQFITDK